MRNHFQRLLMGLLLVLLTFSGIFALFNLRYNQTFLPSQFVPTAENLYKSPVHPPNWIKVIPSPGSVLPKEEVIEIAFYVCHDIVGIQTCNENESPLHVKGDSYQSTDLYREWSNFYLNGRKSNFLLFTGGGSVYGTLTSGTLVMRVNSVLLPGYHLFKIEPANSQQEQNNPDPKSLRYEWAYRVE